jgi:hypothetical protein
VTGPSAEGLFEGVRVTSGTLEDTETIVVESARAAVAVEDSSKEEEVTLAVLVVAEESVRDKVGSIIDGGNESKTRASIFEPEMIAAVYLQQHALFGKAFPATSVLSRAASLGAGEAVSVQDSADGGAREGDPLVLEEGLGEVLEVKVVILVQSEIHQLLS